MTLIGAFVTVFRPLEQRDI